MNREEEQELIREWGHIGEIHTQLLFNTYLFSEFKKLGRYTKKHHSLCEDYCNGIIEEDVLIVKQENKIKDFIEGLNMWFNSHYKIKPLRVEFQRDPRGNTAKVYFNTNEENQHFIIWYVLK